MKKKKRSMRKKTENKEEKTEKKAVPKVTQEDSDDSSTEQEAQQASSSSDTESDSSDSEKSEKKDDSSSSDTDSPEQAPPVAKPAPAPRPPPPKEKNKKAVDFEDKLRTQLTKVDPQSRKDKLSKIRQMLEGRGLQVPGIPVDTMREMLAELERDFGFPTSQRQPAGNSAAPRTPPLEATPHIPKTPPDAVLKSALKKPNQLRRRNQRRIQYADNESVVVEVPIECFRGFGESLWFTMPGAIVCCDECQKAVPQMMGSLQGQPGLSQFAQNKFVCSDCMGL